MCFPKEFLIHDDSQKFSIFTNWLDGFMCDHQLTQKNYHLAINMFEKIWLQFQNDRFSKWKEQFNIDLNQMSFDVAQLSVDSDDFRVNIQELQKKVRDLEEKLNKPSP